MIRASDKRIYRMQFPISCLASVVCERAAESVAYREGRIGIFNFAVLPLFLQDGRLRRIGSPTLAGAKPLCGDSWTVSHWCVPEMLVMVAPPESRARMESLVSCRCRCRLEPLASWPVCSWGVGQISAEKDCFWDRREQLRFVVYGELWGIGMGFACMVECLMLVMRRYDVCW